jgi:hypothetical protein
MIRKILWLLATLLLAHVQLAAAQQPSKTPRIGFLFVGSKDQPHRNHSGEGCGIWAMLKAKHFDRVPLCRPEF